MKKLIGSALIAVALMGGAGLVYGQGETVTTTDGLTYEVPLNRKLITVPVGTHVQHLKVFKWSGARDIYPESPEPTGLSEAECSGWTRPNGTTWYNPQGEIDFGPPNGCNEYYQ